MRTIEAVSAISLHHGLMLAAILFALGTTGVLVRPNPIFFLMSIEREPNAVGPAFVCPGARGDPAAAIISASSALSGRGVG